MEFEWDADKARRNLAKHRISFDVAKYVFDDPLHIVVPDRFEDGEQRWHAVGLVGGVLILLVVHSYRDAEDKDRIRIIGARKATPHERRRYEED
ncbi:BrnT family toxin [Corticibacterium sp. UT-5YL-CI-8]|nr:BrnT family toxin [Tianweitania sp. UT-5YL-CI-8]